MKKILVVTSLPLLCGMLLAQTQKASSPSPKPAAKAPAPQKTADEPPSTASNVAPDAAVVTVNGVCATGSGETCKTVITRSAFEKAMELLKVPPAARHDFGNTYANLTALSILAEKRGLENDPAFNERMKFLRMNTLANLLQQKMQDEIKVSDEEVQSFYAENSAKFAEMDISRLMVPKSGEKTADPKAIAEKLRERAAAGEPLDKLQEEAWKASKAEGAAPKTDLGWRRAGMMDPRHEKELADLRSGQVSTVIDDPQNLFVYKINGKRMVPLEQEKENISRAIKGEKMQAEAKALMSKIQPQFNEAYFGKEPAQKPGEEGERERHQPPTAAPSTPKK